MKLIVAVDERWGIGRGNALLFSIPEDMAFFRQTTLYKIVVMGRSTLETFPKAAPLKNRINIVLTRDESKQIEGALICNTMTELWDVLAQCTSDDVFVIGGGSVYTQLLDYCDEALVTKVKATAQADTFFPNLDSAPNWTLAETSEEKNHGDLRFCFCTYKNERPSALPQSDESNMKLQGQLAALLEARDATGGKTGNVDCGRAKA